MSTSVKITNKGGTALIAVLLLVLSVVGYMATKYKAKYEHEKDVSFALSQSMNVLNDSAKIYRTKYGTSVAQIQTLQMKSENVKTLYKTIYKYAEKAGAPNSISTLTNVVHDTINTIAYVDSLSALHANYVDNWANIQATIYRNKKAMINYAVKDSFLIVDYYKQHRWLFGLIKWKTRQDNIQVENFNPHATISKFQVIKIIQ